MCAMVKSRYIGYGHPTCNRNPYNGYINPYYWVDDHPLLYGNNRSLDPGTCEKNWFPSTKKNNTNLTACRTWKKSPITPDLGPPPTKTALFG